MLQVDFYTKEDCLLCEEALTLLETLRDIHPFNLNICDIHERDDWMEAYFLLIPVVAIKDEILYGEKLNLIDMDKTIQKYL